MHHYKKLAARLFILGAMLAVVFSMPQPAFACDSACQACVHRCIVSYQACVRAGAEGCDIVLEQCSNNCQLE